VTDRHTLTLPTNHIFNGSVVWGPEAPTNSSSWAGQTTQQHDITLTWTPAVPAIVTNPTGQINLTDGATVVSGVTFTQNAGTINSRDWRITFLVTGTQQDFNLVVTHSKVSAINYIGYGFNVNGGVCDIIDTDNDGIANYLDLDSDNDGCFDAYESSVTGSTNDGSVTDSLIATTKTEVGLNGLANSIETNDRDSAQVTYISTYNNYATVDFLNACADTDMDGLPDLVDIDDDNDGIRDSDEASSCFYMEAELQSGKRANLVQVTTGLNMVAAYSHPEELVDSINGTGAADYAVQMVNSQALANQTIYQFEFAVPINLNTIYLQYVNGNSHFINGANVKLQGSQNGSIWMDLNTGATYNLSLIHISEPTRPY